jgi:hypothetical protein
VGSQAGSHGIQAGRARFVEHGLGAEFCLFGVDGSDDVEAVVSAALSAHAWDCVVVGRGVRNSLELFERLINLVRRHAPDAAIAFNATRRRRSTQPRAGWKPAVDARAALRRGAPLPHDGPRG